MTLKNTRTIRRLRWASVSALLIVALLLPAAQPAAMAQSCEGDGCATAAEDVGRFVAYGQVGSSVKSDNVEFSWTTAYEAFNAGFNIVIETAEGFVAINDELIPSSVIDSLEPQQYRYTAATSSSEFYLEHVTIEGASYRNGPFTIGAAVGEAVEPVETDWGAIRAESDALAAVREAARIVEINKALDAVRGPAPSPDEPLVEQSAGVLGERSIYLPLVAGSGQLAQAAEADDLNVVVPGATVNIIVKEKGLYRVEFNDIDKNGTGVDLEGVPSAYLALTNKGVPVRIRMVAAQNWGDGAYFEFVGEGIDTLYTDENVYVLSVDRSKAFRTYRNLRAPDMAETAPTYYRETIRFEENNKWILNSTGEDPWAWEYRNARPSAPKTDTYSLTGINQLSSNGPSPIITTEVWGGNSSTHRVTISINGTQVQDIRFAGAIAQTISSQVSNGILQNGNNSVRWSLPGDTGAQSDLIALEAVTVEYSRTFMAQDGALSFESDAKLFTVDGLPSEQVVVFSYFRNRLWRLEEVETSPSANGYNATFPGWGEAAEYFVWVNDSLVTPIIEVGQLPIDITSGKYDFVIIAHPNFIAGLQDLIAARTDEGLRVKVVNVLDVYAQFSDSILDANAIKNYIKHAIVEMDANYFLLVGGDQYDYHNYVNPSAISFMPSLYAPGYSGQNFMPVDPLYTDVDGDGIMDAAIGRFPVKTTQELAAIVRKTLAYSSQGRSALFTADFHDGPNYTNYSQGFASELPATWQVSDAYLEGSSVDIERQNIVDAVNAGVGVVNYLGHSAMSNWTFSNLFNISHVAGLTNLDSPTIVVQYGCWSSLYIHPTNDSMSRVWVVDDGGAAISLGAVGLTSVSADVAIGNEFSTRIAVPGKSIGTAVLEAKQAMAQYNTSADVLLGWVLFGDPTLKVEP